MEANEDCLLMTLNRNCTKCCRVVSVFHKLINVGKKVDPFTNKYPKEKNCHTAWLDPQTKMLESHCFTKQTAPHESTVQ